MASSPLQPSTPSETPRRVAINRSFTVPAKIASTSPNKTLNSPPEIGATEGVETLYVHPNTSIIKFTSSRPASGASGAAGKDGQGTLPWTSPTERTMAVGPMEIYRVPGSVSFLHSGSLLHAILPRSNCWCVDGVSKFALRVLTPDTYYRIELPGETEDDLQEVEKFKETLKKVLFYERTACPFARGFSVDLPQEGEVVRKKRRKSAGPAKRWRLSGNVGWRPEGWVPPEEGEGEESEEMDDDYEGEESDSGSRTDGSELADEVKELSVATPSRPRIGTGFRSVTAPSPTAMRSSPVPSILRTRVDVDGAVEAIERAESSNAPETPQTRTLQAIPTDMPPSPPDSSAGLDYVENHPQAQVGAADERHTEERHDEAPQTASDGRDGQIPNEPTAASEPALQSNVSEEIQLEADPNLPEARKEQQLQEADVPVEVAESSEHEAEVISGPIKKTSQEPDERPSTPKSKEPVAPGTDETIETIETTETNVSHADTRPVTPPSQTTPEDPYAAIQARILARRSIGGTTSFHVPNRKSSTTSSTSTSTSNKSTLSRRSNPAAQQQNQAFTAALVRKACAVFLGPPARLVAIMLKIAARYADAAFGVNSMFYVESPGDVRGAVPGSYRLDEHVLVGEDDGDEEEDWEEDDFGVPLRSPVRIKSGLEGLRERRGWDVD